MPPFFKDISPEVRKQFMIFLERTILVTYIDRLNIVQNDVLSCVNAATEDKVVEVRDQALKLMGVLQGRLG